MSYRILFSYLFFWCSRFVTSCICSVTFIVLYMAMYSHLTNLDVTTFLLLLRLLFLVGDVVPNFVRHFPPHLKNVVVSLLTFLSGMFLFSVVSKHRNPRFSISVGGSFCVRFQDTVILAPLFLYSYATSLRVSNQAYTGPLTLSSIRYACGHGLLVYISVRFR